MFHLKTQSVIDILLKLFYLYTNLTHTVSFTDGYTIISLTVKVVGDAEGCAYLVLPAVALAYGAGLVILHHKALLQLLVYFFSLRCELL